MDDLFKDLSQPSILPVLDRFMGIMSKLMAKERVLSEWTKFKRLLSDRPLDYGKIYAQLSKVQRAQDSHGPRAINNNSNMFCDEYSNTQCSKKKSSSVYKNGLQVFGKDQAYVSQNLYRNTEYSCKSYRSNSRIEDITKQPESLKNWKQNVGALSGSKVIRDTSIDSPSYTNMVDYLNDESVKLPTSKPELMRLLGSSYLVRSNNLTDCAMILAIGFFLLLLKDAYEDATQTCVSIWQIYNKVANRTFSYSDTDDGAVFLKVFNKVLSKKYATDNRKRQKYFLHAVYSDRSLLDIIMRVYKETIADRERATTTSNRKISANSKKDLSRKYSAFVDGYKNFAMVFPLRIYSVREGNLVLQNYGDEEMAHTRLSVLKRDNYFYLIVEEPSEYEQPPELAAAATRTVEHSKSTKQADKNIVIATKRLQRAQSATQQSKLAYIVSSSTKSIGSGSKKALETGSSRSTSKMGVQDLAIKKLRSRSKVDESALVLVQRLADLMSTLNANNYNVESLVKCQNDGKELPFKNPLSSLNEVYPLYSSEKARSPRQYPI